MKSKSDVIASIDPTKTYLGNFVIARINEVECDDTHIPDKLKKGDVIVLQTGTKRRPAVVIRVKQDKVVTIPLTSTENIHNLYKGSSRFFGETWFCNEYRLVEIEQARKSFIGIYDNTKILNEAIKELRKFIKSNI